MESRWSLTSAYAASPFMSLVVGLAALIASLAAPANQWPDNSVTFSLPEMPWTQPNAESNVFMMELYSPFFLGSYCLKGCWGRTATTFLLTASSSKEWINLEKSGCWLGFGADTTPDWIAAASAGDV